MAGIDTAADLRSLEAAAPRRLRRRRCDPLRQRPARRPLGSGLTSALKVAGGIVGILAGLVAGIYMIGGVVIALRLLFHHAALQGIVTAVGQLPRDSVLATALLNVIAPAVGIGLLLAVLYGAFGQPKSRGDSGDSLTTGKRAIGFLVLVLAIVTLGTLPGLIVALRNDGLSLLIFVVLGYGAVVTAGIATACLYWVRRVGRQEGWAQIGRAVAAGGLWAVIAIVPMTMLAGAKTFERAQICTTPGQPPLKGRLIGQSSERLLLEENFSKVESIVAIPTAEVTESEYGDLSSTFACPGTPGQSHSTQLAEAALGGHGSAEEVKLAATLRPRLRFDSAEPWRPISVPAFVGEAYLRGADDEACWERPVPHCARLTQVDQLTRGRGTPDFIDIHGGARNGADYKSPAHDCRGRVVVDCNRGPSAVIYYRRTSHEGRWYWDYWWFFRYNDYIGHVNECRYYCDDHEGDWEGMTVITTASLKPTILGAIYAAHRERILVEASILPVSGTHALAFVADGTHATYPFRCAGRECVQLDEELDLFHFPEDSHDGEAAWGGNNDAECKNYECVQPIPEVGRPGAAAAPLAGEWAGWHGTWGSTCVDGCGKLRGSSPRSPGLQARLQCPWVPTRVGELTPEGTVSKSEALGDSERLKAVCVAQRGGK